MSHSLSTIRDFVRLAVSEMTKAQCHFGHGVLSAYDDAVFLVLASLHLPPETIEPFWDAHLLEEEISRLLELIDKRCRLKIPTAYLVGHTWLGGFKFKSDERALVPRSLLIEALDQLIANTHEEAWPNLCELMARRKSKVLDLCTGGASIAIVAAHRLNEAGINAQLVASDISGEALLLANENIKIHGLGTQIKLVKSDVFKQFKDSETFDLILCNPPYVNAKSIRTLPAEFKHEPLGALASGNDGMNFITLLLQGLASKLRAGGSLLLEIGNEAKHFEALILRLANVHGLAFDFQYIDVTAGSNMVVLINAPV